MSHLQIFQFWNFLPFFVLLKVTYQVTLLDRNWTIFGLFNFNENETFLLILKHCVSQIHLLNSLSSLNK